MSSQQITRSGCLSFSQRAQTTVINPEKLNKSEELLKNYLGYEGFGDSNIEVYDNWISCTSSNSIHTNLTFKDGRVVCFENLKIYPPRYFRGDRKSLPLSPQLARQKGITYGADWHVDISIREKDCQGTELERRNGIYIGTIPMMLKSRNCLLYKKTPRELALLGEDPSDPGGYFVVNGAEKVVLLQEQLSMNKIFLMNSSNKGLVTAKMTALIDKGTSLVELIISKTRRVIKIKFPSMRYVKEDEKTKAIGKQKQSYKSLNVLRVFIILGIENAVEIQNLIALFIKPEKVRKCLLELTQNIVDLTVFPNNVDLMLSKIEKSKSAPEEKNRISELNEEGKLKEVMKILESDLFPHLNNTPGPDSETINERKSRIIKSKINLLAIMVARLLENLAGFRALEDRDSWSNKKIEGAGRQMEQLFRKAWNKVISSVRMDMEKGSVRDLSGVVDRITKNTNGPSITDVFKDSFNTSSWGVKGSQIKNNVAQTLVRESVIATHSHINTIDVPISRTDRTQSLRMIQSSQYGLIDPVYTPEGENCLVRGTLVFNGMGEKVKIEDVLIGDVMLTLNPMTFNLEPSVVRRSFSKKKQIVFCVELINGKKITSTTDHPIFTTRGFISLDSLNLYEDSVCVSYVSKTYDDIEKIICPLNSFNNFIFNFSDEKEYKEILSGRGLINCFNNGPLTFIIARLLGYMICNSKLESTDGSPTLICYFESLRDLNNFRQDLAHIRLEFFTEQVVTENHSYSLKCRSVIAYFFISIGLDSKFNYLPNWLSNSSLFVKKEFLSGILGSVGGLTTSKNRFKIKPLKSTRTLSNALRSVFLQFDVECSVSGRSVKFNNSIFNIENLVKNIGFRYNQVKMDKSFLIVEYFHYFKKIPNSAAKRMFLSSSRIGNLGSNIIPYSRWKNQVQVRFGSLFIPIKSITKAEDQDVFDYTVESMNHTIICANGIVSHNCGILKNTTITTKVSLDRDDSKIIRMLIGDSGMGISRKVFDDFNMRIDYPDKMMVNGKFLGWTQGEYVRNFLIDLRRQGVLPLDMSVIKEDDWLYVDTTPSRLIRPLLIVNPEQQLMLDVLNLRGLSNHELLTKGAMEYISSWEQEYIKVATSTDKIKERLTTIEVANQTYLSAKLLYDQTLNEKSEISLTEAQQRLNSAKEERERVNKNKPYTHCEIDPTAILGVASSLIPWPNHNQAPRNTYQVSMGKQALGLYHTNHLNRMSDGKMKILVFPMRPMVGTTMYSIVGLNSRGPGQNCTIAFMPWPYTEEDSFCFKREFLDNGGFRHIKYLTLKTSVKISDDVNEVLKKPSSEETRQSTQYDHIQNKPGSDPSNGLPVLGAYLKQGDCVIGKVQTVVKTKEIRNASELMRVGDEGIVEKVSVVTDQKTDIVSVKLRMMRVPEAGDKFAPRNAQKGTIGIVMSDIDLPTSKSGIVPDIIVNTMCIPSRMTMSYLMELLSSKHGAMRGEFVNGTAFQPFEFNKYRETLKEYGFNEFGWEQMRSGTTGRLLDAQIYCGPVFFQSLKHHVKDKIQARGIGPVKPISRQPPKGKGQLGGLRCGEMERDCIISHGASSFLQAQYMRVSDAYQTAFCKQCGIFAVYDGVTKEYMKCKLCKSRDYGKCTIPYSYKLLIHLLGALGINMRPEFENSEDYLRKIFSRTSSISRGSIEDAIREQILEDDIAQSYEEEPEEDQSSAYLYDDM